MKFFVTFYGVFPLPDSDSCADSDTNSDANVMAAIVICRTISTEPTPIPMATVSIMTPILVPIKWISSNFQSKSAQKLSSESVPVEPLLISQESVSDLTVEKHC